MTTSSSTKTPLSSTPSRPQTNSPALGGALPSPFLPNPAPLNLSRLTAAHPHPDHFSRYIVAVTKALSQPIPEGSLVQALSRLGLSDPQNTLRQRTELTRISPFLFGAPETLHPSFILYLHTLTTVQPTLLRMTELPVIRGLALNYIFPIIFANYAAERSETYTTPLSNDPA